MKITDFKEKSDISEKNYRFQRKNADYKEKLQISDENYRFQISDYKIKDYKLKITDYKTLDLHFVMNILNLIKS